MIPTSSFHTQISWLHHVPGDHVDEFAAFLAPPFIFIVLECIHCGFDLRAEIGHVESVFVDQIPIILAVPPQSVLALLGSWLFQYDANCVGEANRVVGSVWRQEKHLTLADGNVTVLSIVNDLEKHGSAVLIKPLGCIVDVEVGASIGTPNDLCLRYQSSLQAGEAKIEP